MAIDSHPFFLSEKNCRFFRKGGCTDTPVPGAFGWPAKEGGTVQALSRVPAAPAGVGLAVLAVAPVASTLPFPPFPGDFWSVSPRVPRLRVLAKGSKVRYVPALERIHEYLQAAGHREGADGPLFEAPEEPGGVGGHRLSHSPMGPCTTAS